MKKNTLFLLRQKTFHSYFLQNSPTFQKTATNLFFSLFACRRHFCVQVSHYQLFFIVFCTVGPIKKKKCKHDFSVFPKKPCPAKFSSLPGRHLQKNSKKFTVAVFSNDASPDTPPSTLTPTSLHFCRGVGAHGPAKKLSNIFPLTFFAHFQYKKHCPATQTHNQPQFHFFSPPKKIFTNSKDFRTESTFVSS